MTCSTCPTRIRCFLGLRNCPPRVGGSSSATSSSTDDGRLDVGRVADALKERKFEPNPNLVSMHYTPEKDRVVHTAEGVILKQKHEEPVRLYGGARGGGKAARIERPSPAPRPRPLPRTEVVRDTTVYTRHDDSGVNDVATIMLLDNILHRQPDVVYVPTPAPAPVYEAPAPHEAPAPTYYSPPPAPSPSYYEPPAPSPSYYEAPSPSPSYDSSSYSSDSGSYSSSDW